MAANYQAYHLNLAICCVNQLRQGAQNSEDFIRYSIDCVEREITDAQRVPW